MGFQNNKPETDFRGGGLLSLKILVKLVEKEEKFILEVVEFQKKYENFLFACVCISATFFLKNHFHFGVYPNYHKKIDYKLLCKAKVLKYFLSLNRGQNYDGVMDAFVQICCTHIKQLFFYWKLCFKKN